MSYEIRMVLTPEEKNQKLADIIYLLDSITFPADEPVEIPGRWWWLIRDNEGTVCGFAGLAREDDGAAFLCRVGVLKKHRGRGLQRKTLVLRENLAKKEGFKHIVTYTSTANLSSANSLIKAGYTLFKPKNMQNWLHFYKCIDPSLTREEIREWQNNTEM